MRALGAGTMPFQSYAADFASKLPSLSGNDDAVLAVAQYSCVLDGCYYMKRNRTTQPDIHTRLDDFMAQWNDGYWSSQPETQKGLKKHILQLLYS
jgi:hypothetical protein